MEKVYFQSEGSRLVGNLFIPENFDNRKKYHAVIVSGSWTTVKEQMAGLYAKKLSEKGFVTLAFDFRNYGESEGEPRFFEEPMKKVEDIKSAISYMETLDFVERTQISVVGVCAGSMYTLIAAAQDKRVHSVATAASWLHDEEAVKLFYGGEEGVAKRRLQGQKALKKYEETGEMEYIETISTTNEDAAMFGEYDYYLNPNRGGIEEWSNDKFAVATWEEWLTLNPMPYAKEVTVPTIMIHSDGCVLPDYTKKFFSQIKNSDKELVWMEKEILYPLEHQFNFYDQEFEVNFAVETMANYLSKQE